MPERNVSDCIFCQIIAGSIPASVVYEDDDFVGFLDNYPLFPGHVLFCPRIHYETLLDLPAKLSSVALPRVQLMARAVEAATKAEGSFIAVNNRVSQTVPHLHIHIVPRRRRDGLKGFFWPRRKYHDEAATEEVRLAIRSELEKLIPEERSDEARTIRD